MTRGRHTNPEKPGRIRGIHASRKAQTPNDDKIVAKFVAKFVARILDQVHWDNRECSMCGEGGVVVQLHATNRYHHALCSDCTIGWSGSELTKLHRKCFDKEYSTTFVCCGAHHQSVRNTCKHECDLRTIRFAPVLSEEIQEIYRTVKDVVDGATVIMGEGTICHKFSCHAITEYEFGDDSKESITCSKCSDTWCATCFSSPYHHGQPCPMPDLSDIQPLIDDGSVKLCPICHTASSIDDGCNKVKCGNRRCQIIFCWCCGEKTGDRNSSENDIYRGHYYNHNQPNLPGKCPLYMSQLADN